MTGSIHGEIPETETFRAPPMRKRRKTLRHHFCDGIEAAVKAEPEAFARTRPRTMLGLMVHSLVQGGATGRCDQIKLVVFFLDEAARRREAAEQSAALDDNSEGISAPPSPPEPKWDWSEDGAWDSTPREDNAAAREEKERSEAKTEALRNELRERFHRALEAERLNAERRVRLELEREGRMAAPGRDAAPNPGTVPPSAAREAGTQRVGGRIVER